jgi:DNA-binding CsgD family transcriptional regulator
VRAGAAARRDPAAAAAADRQLGLVAATAGRPADALAHYAAGLAAADEAGDGALAARLRLARAAALQTLGRRDDALGEGRAALAAAEAAGDPALLARAHRALLLLHAWTGPADAARAHGARAVALAEAAGEETLAWSAHWAMAILGGLTGDAAATAHHVAASERLADATGSPVRRLWTAEVALEYMAGVGEWAGALALADRSIAAARALGQRTLLPRLLVWTGLVHRGLGDLPRARAMVDEAWTLSGAGGPGDPADVHAAIPAHTGMAGVLVTAGEHRRALDVGEAGLALADRGGYVAWAVYRLLPFVIEAAIYVEDYDRAAAHNARLRRDARALGHALGLAWADTTDALLAYFTGPPDRAAGMLRAAAAGLEAVPFVFDAARLRRMAAKALRDAGDRAGAEAELRSAHAVFLRLGAERELRGTREQLRELGARPPARAAAGGALGAAALSGREAEVARLVAARKSNKEIAAALDISPRTVSTHLSHIFEKTGVGSRGELTDLVRGAGLAGEV